MIKLSDIHVPTGNAPEAWQNRLAGSQYKPAVKPSPDLSRVLALPRRPQIDEGTPRAHAIVRMMTERFARKRTTPCKCRNAKDHPDPALRGFERDCILQLNLTQSIALYELGMASGLLGPIGVGHGKTILDLLAICALMPPDEPDPRRFEGVLLVPPGLIDQLITEYQLVGEHFRMPSLAVHGRDVAFDAGPREPVLHVIPYSRLQRAEATVLLKKIKPRVIIADEAHSLRNRDAVRTHRVMSYMKDNPTTLFACWTGTITDSSVADYAHLVGFALRYSSPLPLNKETVKEWASALDPKSDWPADPGALLDGLVRTGCMMPGEHIQLGFHRRLVETEGVVATKSSAIDAELRVTVRDAPDVPNTPRADERAPNGFWPGIRDAMSMVKESKTRPDGEILLDPLQVARCCRELACGFFYRWKYPRAEPEDLIELWFAARKAFRAELRDMLDPDRRREHMDSPFLHTLAAMRAHGDLPRGGVIEMVDEETGEVQLVDTTHLPSWPSVHWPKWRDVKDLVKPESEAVWIDEYLAHDAARWALENRGVVWYDKTAFGAMVAKISGLPMHGGGDDAPVKLLGGEYKGRTYPGEKGDRSIICSIKSHGTGRDGLQRLFKTQLVANPPSSATIWEQLLGRLHRIGQLAPVVCAEFYCHTDELEASYGQACSRARYVQNTIGSEQKLNSIDEDD